MLCAIERLLCLPVAATITGLVLAVPLAVRLMAAVRSPDTLVLVKIQAHLTKITAQALTLTAPRSRSTAASALAELRFCTTVVVLATKPECRSVLELMIDYYGEVVRQSLNLAHNVDVARENERRGSGEVRK